MTHNPRILFVCTANRCRSPAAAALFARQIQVATAATATVTTRADDWQILSAGTWARPNLPVTGPMARAAKRVGLDLSHHRAQTIDAILPLTHFTLILTMTCDHQEALCTEFPLAAPRIYPLSAMSGIRYDVSDPIGGPPDDYESCIRDIDRLLTTGMPRILTLIKGVKE